MNTQHFKYAIEVEKTRSITKAAENLFMGQPNLSKSIKELEDSLGFSIFKRTSKGVIPTQKGSEFLVYAQNILDQLEKMDEISNPVNEDMQKFSISIPRGSYIAKGFTNFIKSLDMNHTIKVNIQETNSMQAISNIASGKFNLGIIRYQNTYENYFKDFLKDKKISYDLIWEFEYLALMNEKHVLAKQENIDYNELKKSVEIVHGDSSIPYITDHENKKLSSDHSSKITLYERCNQFELLSNVPATFMWVSPIPENYLKRYGLVQRKCDTGIKKFKDVLIYSKGYKFTKLDKKFIDKLYESKNEVSFKEYF